MFESGFAWVKINHYSYICKILSSENGLYVIKIGDHVFYDVPLKELQPVYGDTKED